MGQTVELSEPTGPSSLCLPWFGMESTKLEKLDPIQSSLFLFVKPNLKETGCTDLPTPKLNITDTNTLSCMLPKNKHFLCVQFSKLLLIVFPYCNVIIYFDPFDQRSKNKCLI